jgi:hypothetical protein
MGYQALAGRMISIAGTVCAVSNNDRLKNERAAEIAALR